MPVSDVQKMLQRLSKRRHPEYAQNLEHWNFCEATYKGGRNWFQDNIFRYIKEGDRDYTDRIKRCYRFNHTREAVDLVQKYIFKSEVSRSEDASAEVKLFWKNASLSGLDIDQFMRLGSSLSSIFGRIWIFTDTSQTGPIATVAEQRRSGARPYAYFVKPQDVLDIGFDDDDKLTWILIREFVRDDKDPLTSTGDIKIQYRLWEKDKWTLFRVDEEVYLWGKASNVEVIATGDNALGEVPCFPLDHVVSDDKYTSPGLINDIAYLDKAVANYLSNLDAIIQDQTFSQLAMPAQGLTPGEDAYDKLLEMGTKRIFTYDGEGDTKPFYLAPDPKQAQLIIEVVNKIISEIYHTIGMAGERTDTDNSVGTDNSSGVAKAYDFERLNSLLTAKAAALQNAENALVTMIDKWHSKTEDTTMQDLVQYPDTFDVRNLYDEFTIAERLKLIDAPQGVRQEQMKQVIDKMFPQLQEDLKKKLTEELKDWPKDPLEMAAEMAKINGTGITASKAPTPASKNGSTKSRQGQVTSETKS
jgi:hypothetical protein